MTTEQVAAGMTGILTGGGTFLMQATTVNLSPVLSLASPVVAALVGGGVAWGVMQANQRAMQREVQKLSSLMLTVSERVARIEGSLSK
jgi:hypothetical protein